MKFSLGPSYITIGDFIISKIEAIILVITTALSFILSYFFELTVENYQQYFAVLGVVMLDGVFGMIAGIRREGFMTYKALKILRTSFVWIAILTVLLSVEKGIEGTFWLSETIMIPFLLFQLISALKNASMAGYIDSGLLNEILDKIDKHKGERK
jgi:small basic protein